MSEEASQTNESASETNNDTQVADTGQQEITQTAQITQHSNKPAGYKPIDETTASPEQVRERLNFLYGQVKTGERTTQELKKIASEQSRLIGELTNGFNGVVNHLQEKNITDNESQLEGQMQQAFERGDNKAFLEAQNKLMDLRVQKRVQAATRPQQPQQTQQQPTYNSAAQIANEAMQDGDMSPQEYRATELWQNERDDTGNLLRPWAYSDSPSHQQALRESQAVWANPKFNTNDQRLAEVDRRMGMQKRTAGQSVMGGSLTVGKKNNSITISPEMAKLAIRTKFGGSKAKTDADHIEAWKQQIASVKSQKGARK